MKIETKQLAVKVGCSSPEDVERQVIAGMDGSGFCHYSLPNDANIDIDPHFFFQPPRIHPA